MKPLKFKKIDAFATRQSRGNPAGMVLLNSFDDITPDEMQQIARELKGFVSEVGYVCQAGNRTFQLKYYSSEKEVDFCGHATIAAMYDIIKNSPDLLTQPRLEILTPKGNLMVENKVATDDAVFISAPAPVYSKKKIPMPDIANALDISIDEIHPDIPVSVINAGLETLLVPINSLDAILAISPEMDKLKAFCMDHAVDIVTVFSTDVADPRNRFRTRVFAPAFGYLEDPATGSGNAALGHYLLSNHMWPGDLIFIEQNNNREYPNIVKLSAKQTSGDPPQVMFGGSALTRIDGEYMLY